MRCVAALAEEQRASLSLCARARARLCGLGMGSWRVTCVLSGYGALVVFEEAWSLRAAARGWWHREPADRCGGPRACGELPGKRVVGQGPWADLMKMRRIRLIK